ncbi:hypothetical protein BHOIPH791_06650 [Bartonella henselae]|uniref:Uncharacterized protein n=3 Tax=Bartonella TaxID=773 RepID=X5M6Z5_BARHN|nr:MULTISPECIES: hypothetical protein [Bartonella]ATP12451.1 hypothetical protein BhenCHDE101_04690 [Bartonella henselae]ETS04111.1 hypothetical protein Q655_01637 [Bartonella henselae JK 51]ETS10883.1 hypothetical protein Q654_00031 [Bartonella henselae JK 50]ETS11168.1 hypothetical protein Q653_00082 [Bartonella henselae JK 42]ETS15174.1 hypothetical protein Q652_00215 [Bartonella henselae JK 41]
MAHHPPTITQPTIARALREAKKQGCELIEIKPTGELFIHINKSIASTTIGNVYSIEDFPPLEDEKEEYTTNHSCPSVDGIKF